MTCALADAIWLIMTIVVRFVPSWFPGASWKRRLYSNRDLVKSILENSYNFAKDQMVSPRRDRLICHVDY